MQKMVTFSEAIRKFFTTWSMQGRASLSEYWWICLLCHLVGIFAAPFMVATLFVPYVGILVVLLLLMVLFCGLGVPFVFLSIRRFHDIGMSGWGFLLLVIPIANLVLWLVYMTKPSLPEENAYGPVPNA